MSIMKNPQSGFALVELLVTIILIGITVGWLAGIFTTVQNLQSQNQYTDMAARAAQREIETLRNDNYASLTPGQTIDFTSDLPSQLPRGSTGTVQVSQPVSDLRRVDVTVSYKVNGNQRNITLSSLIGVIGITQ
jgi:prepilin-type N-terminal cleavage/methylation domain-containing protein